MELGKKKIVVLGGGESGTGAAILAQKLNFETFVSDFSTISLKYRTLLEERGIAFEMNGHSEEQILDADLVIKSPGIPDDSFLIKRIKHNGIEIIDEVEFAFLHSKAPVIAITGSNGKTTTSTLIHHILKSSGLKSVLVGNIGRSYARAVAEAEFDYAVIEVSSFQLDYCKFFKPQIAVLTNITPDHLDRYQYKFENYKQSKFRITAQQDQDDILIYNSEDEHIKDLITSKTSKAQLLPFGMGGISNNSGAYYSNSALKFKYNEKEMTIREEELALKGNHNIQNTMAAGLASMATHLKSQKIKQSITTFTAVEHRLEMVNRIEGVVYINDSKATNVNSAYYALQTVQKPIIWIAGGVDKGNDYKALLPLVREKVKAIICLGKDNEKLFETFSNVVDEMISLKSMTEAVGKAYEISNTGDTVLLSPACASFDLFKNYEDRGDQFKTQVKRLAL
ncbi:MAG: UDP-N-acetylmuramoyl-L-alanine--D-glutamate ligase [Flavobacteriaceae bacterium]